MTTADGRSPGSRVATFRRLPGTRDPSGHLTEDSPLTVAGAAAELDDDRARTAFPFDPNRGTVDQQDRQEVPHRAIARTGLREPREQIPPRCDQITTGTALLAPAGGGISTRLQPGQHLQKSPGRCDRPGQETKGAGRAQTNRPQRWKYRHRINSRSIKPVIWILTIAEIEQRPRWNKTRLEFDANLAFSKSSSHRAPDDFDRGAQRLRRAPQSRPPCSPGSPRVQFHPARAR
jgi:hypothetical protein